MTVTHLTKFSFCRPTLEAVTGSGFRQVWPTSGYFGVALGWFGMKYTVGYATGAKTSQVPTDCLNLARIAILVSPF